jgi:phospholipid/cholesterol/gamma-HCH transport system substrate-binding protein
MIAKKNSLEIKVGIFVIVGMVILVSFVFLIRDFELIKPGYHIKVIFGFANGLKVNAPVRVAGVDAGEIKDVRVIFDTVNKKTVVETLVWLKKSIKISYDSQVWINTLGLLGEQYVEIVAGKDNERFLKEGDYLLGNDPISTHEIARMTQTIAQKLEASMESLNSVLQDENTKTNLKGIISDLKEITSSSKLIIDKISKGEGTLGKIIYDEKIYNDLETLTGDIKKHPWKLLLRTKEKK